MTEPAIMDKILKELRAAKKAYPSWPQHIVARAAIVGEEAGELIRAALLFKYEGKVDQRQEMIKQMESEAIQTAAMAIRFLESLKDLDK